MPEFSLNHLGNVRKIAADIVIVTAKTGGELSKYLIVLYETTYY
jgi:hypothetical protein